MKKSLLAALVVAVAATANAGSSRESLEGSLDVSKGLAGSVFTTLRAVSTNTMSALDNVSEASVSAATKASDVTMYILENPSEASAKAVDASEAGARWTIATSGEVLSLAADGSVQLVFHPIKASKAAGRASVRVVNASIDASGRVLTASGEALKDAYGDDMQLVLDGSGAVATVASDAAIFVKDQSVAAAKLAAKGLKASGKASVKASTVTINFINDTVIDGMIVSGKEALALSKGLAIRSAAASKNVFDASTKRGEQYRD